MIVYRYILRIATVSLLNTGHLDKLRIFSLMACLYREMYSFHSVSILNPVNILLTQKIFLRKSRAVLGNVRKGLFTAWYGFSLKGREGDLDVVCFYRK